MAGRGATTVAISTIDMVKSTMGNDNPTKASGMSYFFQDPLDFSTLSA